MAIRILAIGKSHESWVKDGIERYEKRLKRPFNVEWVLIPHSARETQQARQEESERLLSRVKPSDFVVLLDERGDSLSSPVLCRQLTAHFTHGKHVTIIIGGAYGVDETLMARANETWSLSKLVFPHQLVRLLLIEQLYRAQEIENGSAYHHK